MKKLVFIFAVSISSIVNAQYDIKLINDIKTILQTTDDNVAVEFLDNLYSYAKEYPLKTVKYGDTDAPMVKGLLKTLFTDSLTKYEYIKANPRIAALHISSPTHNPELKNKDMTFIRWMSEYVYNIDIEKFDIVYWETEDREHEFLYVYDKMDINHENYLRTIMITYRDPQTNRNDPYNNLLSIQDSNLNP
jgi:hypothetical protein